MNNNLKGSMVLAGVGMLLFGGRAAMAQDKKKKFRDEIQNRAKNNKNAIPKFIQDNIKCVLEASVDGKRGTKIYVKEGQKFKLLYKMMYEGVNITSEFNEGSSSEMIGCQGYLVAHDVGSTVPPAVPYEYVYDSSLEAMVVERTMPAKGKYQSRIYNNTVDIELKSDRKVRASKMRMANSCEVVWTK
jgi:hypothetical protein